MDRHPPRLARGDVEQPQVRVGSRVPLIAHVFALVALLLFVGRLLVLRGEGDPLPIGQPGERVNRGGVLVQLPWLAHPRIHQIQGRFPFLAVRVLAHREKGEHPAVGAPPRARITLGVARELDVLGARVLGQRQHPDIGIPRVLLEIGLPDRVQHGVAVGRHPHVAQPGHLEQVVQRRVSGPREVGRRCGNGPALGPRHRRQAQPDRRDQAQREETSLPHALLHERAHRFLTKRATAARKSGVLRARAFTSAPRSMASGNGNVSTA